MGEAVPTRRTVLRTAALATTALAAPFVRGAHAAGKLSLLASGTIGSLRRAR
jgi:hypothetical protein